MDLKEERSKQAFVELHDRLGPRLLAYLRRRVPDMNIAAELWAESWALAFENWRRRRSADPAASEAWVFGIARHQLAAYYRSGSIEQRALARLHWSIPPVEGTLDEALERVDDLDALPSDVARLLQALPHGRREAVRLRIIEGLSYRDVASRLGCSEQAARAHVSRGLRHIARDLKRQDQHFPELITR